MSEAKNNAHKKKQVGVLTWFRDSNYGTILQAYALQQYLKLEGYDPQLINFMPPREQTKKIELTFWQKCFKKLDWYCERFFAYINKEGFAAKKEGAYSFIDDECKVTEPVVTEDDFAELNDIFDAFICGSDQVWNPYWMDSKFYLDFVKKGKKKIAYAPSFGVTQLEDNTKKRIEGYLVNFDSLSVREKSALLFFDEELQKRMTYVVDPIFLLSKTQWSTIADRVKKSNEKYIFYYFLSYNYKHWRATQKYAKKNGLKIIGIPVFGRHYYSIGCKKFPFATPEQFLNLIKYAEYVVTDSFHATAFSIRLNKQFFTFERFMNSNEYSQNSRVNNLIHEMGLEDRIIGYNSCSIGEKSEIDYDIINDRLNIWIEKSKDFLITALGKGINK